MGLGPIVGYSVLFITRATLVGRACCAGCVESTMRYCNNYI